MLEKKDYYVLTYNGAPIGESIQSRYDLNNACKLCGTKAKLIGNLYTKGIKWGKDFFSTLDDDKIISENLYNELTLADFKLNNLLKIVDHRGNHLPFFHLSSELYFPKLLSESKGLIIEDQCPIYKQDGYYNNVIIGNLEKKFNTFVHPLELFYENIDVSFLQQADFFNTWEHMGKSSREVKGNKVIGYARPLLIVSEKVKEVFNENKVKNSVFTKISISPALYQ